MDWAYWTPYYMDHIIRILHGRNKGVRKHTCYEMDPKVAKKAATETVDSVWYKRSRDTKNLKNFFWVWNPNFGLRELSLSPLFWDIWGVDLVSLDYTIVEVKPGLLFMSIECTPCLVLLSLIDITSSNQPIISPAKM